MIVIAALFRNLFGSDYSMECKSSSIAQSETMKQKVLDLGDHFGKVVQLLCTLINKLVIL